MQLIKRMEREGAVLFRWRSFVPLVLVPLALVALREGAEWQAVIGETGEDMWTVLALLVSLAGFAVRCATVGFIPGGTSGRNTRCQRADRLNTAGIYAIVRNPLYLGNFIILLGIVLATKAWWFPVVYCFAYWVYVERLVAAEEAFLARKFGEEYARWASHTPAFVPRLRHWRAPELAFSPRTVFRREYNGLLAIAAAFLAIEVFTDLIVEGEDANAWLREDWLWPALFAFSVVLFLALRTLKRHTRILRVPGR